MYEVSSAFHTAIRQLAPQVRALLDFGTAFFTNENISATSGINLTESVNLEEDLTIGSCTSATFSTVLFNANHLLDDFAYGRFKASLGVLISADAGQAYERTSIVVGNTVISGGDMIRINGMRTSVQPGFDAAALVLDDTVLYAIGTGGAMWKAEFNGNDLSDGQDVSLNEYMQDKMSAFAERGRYIYRKENQVQEFFADGTIENWEYCPLGVFIAEMPTLRKVELVSVDAYDSMKVFDATVDEFVNGIQYPITLGEIFSSLCTYFNMEAKSLDFPNSTMVIEESPGLFQMLMGRDLLTWIAEAASGFCRMTRDGKVEITWFSDTDYDMGSDVLYSVERAERPVKRIDKLQVSVTDSDIGVILGDGENGYQIVDNPFLYGTTDEQVRTKAEPIFSRLNSFEEYYPTRLMGVSDPSVEAGDIIAASDTNTAVPLPIFVQSIAWSGGAPLVTIESTGSERRPSMSQKNREIFRQGVQKHEFEVSLERLRSDVQLVSNQQSEQATTILQDAQQILFSALKSYVESGDFEAFQQSIRTSLSIMSDQIEINFQTQTGQIDAATGKVQDYINTQSKYIRFVDGDIILGKEGNEIVLTLENDRVSFTQDGLEVAYFANQKLYVTSAEFVNSIKIGSFFLRKESNGSLSLVKG